jgi:hypothetical protein
MESLITAPAAAAESSTPVSPFVIGGAVAPDWYPLKNTRGAGAFWLSALLSTR